jgi:hypothetical protein
MDLAPGLFLSHDTFGFQVDGDLLHLHDRLQQSSVVLGVCFCFKIQILIRFPPILAFTLRGFSWCRISWKSWPACTGFQNQCSSEFGLFLSLPLELSCEKHRAKLPVS